MAEINTTATSGKQYIRSHRQSHFNGIKGILVLSEELHVLL